MRSTSVCNAPARSTSVCNTPALYCLFFASVVSSASKCPAEHVAFSFKSLPSRCSQSSQDPLDTFPTTPLLTNPNTDHHLPRFYCRYSIFMLGLQIPKATPASQTLTHISVSLLCLTPFIPQCLRANFQFQSSKKTSALKACLSGTMFSLSNMRTGFPLPLYLLKQTNLSISQQNPN